MLDFKQKLDELLSLETEPPARGELAELAAQHNKFMAALNKTQTGISMQVEEIYDIVKESGDNAQALRDAKKHAGRMAETVVSLCDIIEDFYAFARQSGDEALARQAALMWNNARALLETSALTRLGEAGQALDPEIHAVQSAAPSHIPYEHVLSVLRSGYRYMGAVLRKAAVIVSAGTGETSGHE